MAASTATLPEARVPNRWLILTASIVSMVAVANYQYGWTLFVKPLQKHFGVEAAVIQITIPGIVLLETWLAPVEGCLVDTFGPRPLVALGAVFARVGRCGRRRAGVRTALYLVC